jgi:tRNA nucleotidyltransferase (CCA-adding enzyme)
MPEPGPDLVARVPAAVVEVCLRLHGAGEAAFLVGGGVRDLLLSRPHPPDWDVATSARPERVQALFPKAVPTGLQHGTVTVLLGGLSVEVTTFRVEGAYSDGRRPDSVQFVAELEDDLARRDFTVNALALDVRDGSVRDPFGGRADLEARCIRAVGDPRARFGEDGLRILRAVRFAATLEFAIEPGTLAAIPAAIPTFRKVAPERVRAELEKLLEAPRPSAALDPMLSTGLAAELFPGLAAAPKEVRRRALARTDAAPGDWRVRFAALHCEIGSAAARQALERLRPSARDLERATALVDACVLLREAPADGPGVRRVLSRIGREAAPQALALSKADLTAGAPSTGGWSRAGEALAIAEEALGARAPLEVADLAIDGDEVRALLGLPPGPAVGSALRALLDAVLEDPAQNTPEALRALLGKRGAR